MNVIDFVFAPEVIPFAVALVLFLALASFTGLSSLLGLSADGLFDGDADLDADVDASVDGGGDVEADADVSGGFGMGQVLAALGIGRLPLTVVLLAGLFSFASSGYLIQYVAMAILGALLPATLATAVALVPALLLHSVIVRGAVRLLPDEGPTVATIEQFIGSIALVTNGPARVGAPGQARFVDSFGHQQTVLVEPEAGGGDLNTGAEVVLTERISGAKFRAIPADFVAAAPAEARSKEETMR